jgi:hypothetical protein
MFNFFIEIITNQSQKTLISNKEEYIQFKQNINENTVSEYLKQRTQQRLNYLSY